ncbi:MAG: hypothetical protein OEQ53_22655, partial [Saprospiraceae bacterium]|nr:hypothetical protein [Saprospiraceae bacterium]
FIIAAIGITNLNQYLQLSGSTIYLREAAEIIKQDLAPDQYIYTNHQNLLYFLTQSSIPTKYVHTSLIYKPDLAKAFGINTASEIRNIIEKESRYYLFKGTLPEPFRLDVDLNYAVIRNFEDEIRLFRRISKN